MCKSTVSYVCGQTHRSRDVTPLHLMHDRLNHLNVRQMVQMRSSDMVEGADHSLRLFPLLMRYLSCESCIIGKSHRANMPRKSSCAANDSLPAIGAF